MIRVVTDSTANLPAQLASRHRIAVVPLRVIFADATYRDGVDITPDQFYRLLAASPTLPTTSQPPAVEFEEAYRQIVEAGDEVVALTISERLSGTYASALAAVRAFPGASITVFDSRSTGSALAAMALLAAEMAEAGAGLADVMHALEVLRERTMVLFVVDTLEYLRKGGRIGGAAALAGSLLSIKPVLAIRDGRVEPWGKVRGRRKALQTAVEAVSDAVGRGEAVRASVMHASCPDEAAALAGDLAAALACPTPPVYELSPVLGVHVGPGTVGMSAYSAAWL